MREKPKRTSSSTLLLAALVPVFILSVMAWKLMMRKNLDDPSLVSAEFNLSAKPETTQTVPKEVYKTRFEEELEARGGPDGQEAPLGVVKEGAGPHPDAGMTSKRRRELDFLRKYDKLIRQYQKHLVGISRRAYMENELARKVDSDFAKLPRYMKLSKRYTEDRDIFKWARGVIALPEVRKTISKHAKNPEAWKLGINMMLEAMKKPPPKKVHDEALHFMTTDKKMSEYVMDFTQEVIPNMGEMITKSAPPDADLSGLSKIGSALTGMEDPLAKKSRQKKPRSKN